MVGSQQRVVVLPARLCRQGAAEEVGDIGECRSPRDGLPVHHGQRALGTGLPEEHVVEAVVAVDQSVHPVRRCLGGEVGVERADQTLAHHPMPRRDGVAESLGEPGPQLRDQRLIQR